jgi:ribosomal protein S18 acetylase RimI-like enzyme
MQQMASTTAGRTALAGPAMSVVAISYFKRYKLEIDLAGLAAPAWPDGFAPVAWRADLLDAHADVLAASFHGEIDAVVFPSLGHRAGCGGLMFEVARRHAFIPEATWLVVGPDGPCGSIQALRERGVLGAIQNVGITPAYRGRGLGKALVLQSLCGMYQSGLGRAVLEATAHNEAAMRLYAALGFRRTKVLYKAVPGTPPGAAAAPLPC